MPRHPPIALKTLDRSHCQCPSAQSEGLSLQPLPCGVGVRAIPKELSPEPDPVRDPNSMSLAQKDQLLEIGSRVRLGKPIICGRLSVSRDKSRTFRLMKFEQIFSLRCQNRTSGKPRSSPQTFIRMTFSPPSLDTPSSPQRQESGGAGRDRTDDILLAKQALSQLSYGP